MKIGNAKHSRDWSPLNTPSSVCRMFSYCPVVRAHGMIQPLYGRIIGHFSPLTISVPLICAKSTSIDGSSRWTSFFFSAIILHLLVRTNLIYFFLFVFQRIVAPDVEKYISPGCGLDGILPSLQQTGIVSASMAPSQSENSRIAKEQATALTVSLHFVDQNAIEVVSVVHNRVRQR